MTKKIWIYFYTSTNDENLASGCDQRCGSAVCVSDEVPPQSRMVVVSGLVEPTPPIVSNKKIYSIGLYVIILMFCTFHLFFV